MNVTRRAADPGPRPPRVRTTRSSERLGVDRRADEYLRPPLSAAPAPAARPLHIVARLDFYPHYHIATWHAAVVCLWTGLRALRRARIGVVIGVVLAVGLLIVTGWASIEAGLAAGGRVNPP